MLKIITLIGGFVTAVLGAATLEDIVQEKVYRQCVENFQAGKDAPFSQLSKDFVAGKKAPDNLDDFSATEEVSAYLLALIKTNNLNELAKVIIEKRAKNYQARNHDYSVYGELLVSLRQYEEAVAEFRVAAKFNFAQAQNNLGLMYRQGHGVEQNDKEAVKWFRLAADQGYASAQTNLGVMYYEGVGVERSKAEAAKWWRLAADQGFSKPQNTLEQMQSCSIL